MSAESQAVKSNPNRCDATRRGPAGGSQRLLWAIAGALALASATVASDTSLDQTRLTSVTTVTEGKSVTVVIEASEPAPYAVVHPDPLTVVVDLRNVSAAGVSASGARRVGPVADVAVEDARADDGAIMARVRVSLAAPVKPAVRSRRGAILIEFGGAGASPTPAGPSAASAVPAASAAPRDTAPAKATASAQPSGQRAPAQATPAAQGAKAEPLTLKAVDITHASFGTRVTVTGTDALPGEARTSVALVDATATDPARLVVDLPGVTARSQTVRGPADGPVARVRVAQNSRQPLVARVVIDLRRPAPYRVDHVGGQVTVVLEPAAEPAAPAPQPAAPPAEAQPAAPPAAPVAAPAVEQPRPASTQPAAAGQPPVQAGPTPVVVPLPAAAEGRPAAPAGQATASAAEATRKPAAAAAEPPKAEAVPPAAAKPAAEAAPLPPVAAPPTATPAPPPATAGATQAEAAQPPQRAYTGTPVTFDFVGADLRAVLRAFSDKDISGLNVVIDPAIQGTVDVSLREVPWDQALEVILRAHKLGYVIENNVVRIASLKALAEEEQERQKLAEAQAKGGQLKVLTRSLSYAKAADLAKLLKDARVISERGTAFVDERSNTLIINDLPTAIAECETLIATLDRPEPQVEIEARIVQTTRENARALGVQWGVTGRAASELANTTPFRFPAQGSVSGRTGGVQGNPIGPERSATPTGVNLPVTGATSAVGLAMGTLNGSFNLDVALSALEKKGHGRILSTPRVVMQNNVEAEMYQGIQIPIQTISNNTVTVTFKDAALSLKVRPQITASDTVIMDIKLENASPDYSREVNGIPPIDTQRAVTQVLVSDGDTTVIGGIQVQRETNSNDRVPGLARIPLLGWLFKRDSTSDDNRELLIFITPKIRR